VRGSVETPAGKVPRIEPSWDRADYVGTFKARWGVGRMNYRVDPGLYALGNPDEASPVLVTANYKMSFDRLRKALPGIGAWILVLDTKGINVWCAAGKGSFGTMELVNRMESSALSKVVSHRQIILPQLAGPGVAAHLVKKLSGFKVIYGPIRAEDLPEFLRNGFKATPEMRIKSFPMGERIVLIPVELVGALKVAIVVIPILILLSGLLGPLDFTANVLNHGLLAAAAVLTAVFCGAVLTPVLLPWLPGRPFSLKGLPLGILGAAFLLLWGRGWTAKSFPEMLAWFLFVPAAAAYLAMNFTGASTYTSLSGVKKEIRWALPFEIAASVAGLGLWVYSLSVA
jgi:CO dehydrogenase/acetyl-CoA synthase delta subunit